MKRVPVSERVLRWALERSNRTEDDLRQRFPRIGDWLTGRAQPTLRQLERLAATTYTPLGFLLLEDPPSETLPIPHFRTGRREVRHRPSSGLIDTIHQMQQRQAWMRDYLAEQGHQPLSFVGSASLNDDPLKVGTMMRSVLGLAGDWAQWIPTWTDALASLRDRMEAAGMLVMSNSVVGNNTHRSLDVEEFRGFIRTDEYAPLAFLNARDSKAAQLFTLAHELAHVLVGSSASFDLATMQPATDRVETFCNRAAAEFLVPGDRLTAVWRSVQHDPQPWTTLARRFKVSPLVVARRAQDAGLITRSDFFAFYRQYMDLEIRTGRTTGGGQFYPSRRCQLGRRLSEAVVLSAQEGRTLYTEAYRLTGMRGRTFDRYAESLLGTNAPRQV